MKCLSEGLVFFLYSAFKQLPDLRLEGFTVRHQLYIVYRASFQSLALSGDTTEVPTLLHHYLTDCLLSPNKTMDLDTLYLFEFALWELYGLVDSVESVHSTRLMQWVVLHESRRRLVANIAKNLAERSVNAHP